MFIPHKLSIKQSICNCRRFPALRVRVRRLLSHDCILIYPHNCSLIVSMTVPTTIPWLFPRQSSSGPTHPGSYDGVSLTIVPVKSLTSSRSWSPPNVFVELHYLKLASYPQSTQTLLQYQIVVLCRPTGTSQGSTAPQLQGWYGNSC